MYPSSPLRSTLNTGYITGVDMCKVCTQAVHSVALWTRVTLQVWTCVKSSTYMRFMPKVTLFYAQSDPFGLCPKWLSFMPKVTPSVNLCPKWLSLVFGEKVHSVVLTCGLCPKWLSFYAQSDPLECRGVNFCPKWLSFMPQVTIFRP